MSSEDEESASEPETNLNAPPQPNHHPRSASTSVPDRRKPVEKEKRRHIRTASGSQATPANLLAPQPQTAASVGGSPHTAKDTFLNYFFGGPNGQPGSEMRQPPRREERREERKAPVSRDILPDLGSRRGTMSRASGLESRAAYDMKSLGKHIDLAPAETPNLSPREEMETTLIRSLIASYFGITRQTIQDLVPKAIMHLLVSLITASLTAGKFLPRFDPAEISYEPVQA